MKANLLIAGMTLTLVLASCGGKEDKGEENVDTTPNVETRDPNGLKIAYYDQDSLFLNFDYYVERDSVMTKKGLAFQSEIQRRTQALESYIMTNDQKARSGLLSEVEIMNVQQSIQEKQNALMQYQEQQGALIEQETVRELEAIGNKISEFGKQYCEENGIDMLLVKAGGGQFNYIHPSMDVTDAFTSYLNQQQAELEAGIEE